MQYAWLHVHSSPPQRKDTWHYFHIILCDQVKINMRIRALHHLSHTHTHTVREKHNHTEISLDFISSGKAIRSKNAFTQIKYDFHLYVMLHWGTPHIVANGGKLILIMRIRACTLATWEMGTCDLNLITTSVSTVILASQAEINMRKPFAVKRKPCFTLAIKALGHGFTIARTYKQFSALHYLWASGSLTSLWAYRPQGCLGWSSRCCWRMQKGTGLQSQKVLHP